MRAAEIVSRPDIFLSTFQLSSQASISAINPAGRAWMRSAMQLQVECPAWQERVCRTSALIAVEPQGERDASAGRSRERSIRLSRPSPLSPSLFLALSLSVYPSIYLSPYVGANDSSHCLLVDNPGSRTSFAAAVAWLMAEKLFPC